MRLPFFGSDPGAGPSGTALARLTAVAVVIALIIANAIAAVIVFAFASLIGAPSIEDRTEVLVANAIALGVYLSLALIVGIVWGVKRMRPLREFLRGARDPTPEDRKMVLRGPLRIAVVHIVLWGVAVPVFAALNASFSGELAFRVGASVGVTGVVITAVTYLLTERLLRPATARVLATEAPERPVVPGVAARSLLAWMLGTGVALLGLVSVAVSTLVEEDFSRDQLALVVLALSGIALLVGLLVTAIAARATADPIRSVRDALAKVEEGDLDVEVPVYDGSEVGLLQAGFNRTVAGLREREQMREALGTYLDPDVAEHILEQGPSLEGEEVEVTLLFLDVRDFTGFAERSEPTEVVSTINRLFEIAVPVIHEHGGLIDKFIGDGLLAVFGALHGETDHADKALRAAGEVATAVEKEFQRKIEIGIGINTGRVIAGNVGGAGRLEFSVIGDAVNVAARVEAATRQTGDTLLVSGSTAEKLSGEIELEPRPGVELKGKRTPVEVFAPVFESEQRVAKKDPMKATRGRR